MAHNPIAYARHKRHRILFCTLGYEPGPASGAEREARLQVEELVSRGHVVTVVCPSSPGVSSGWIGGVFVRRLPWLHRWWYMRTFTYWPMLAAFLLLRVRRYDLVHVYSAGLQADVVVLVAGLLRRPVYVTVAGGGRGREIKPLRPVVWLTRHVGLRRAARVQALSEEIVGDLLQLGVRQDKVVRIPSGVDIADFPRRTDADQAVARLQLRLPAEPAIVLYAGRFARHKGVPELLDVWRRTSQLHGAVLVLVGAPALDDPIGPIDVDDRVIVRDWTDDILAYYRASEIFVLPSYAEGMSLALIEAMACGMAVLVTRVGAAPQMIRDGIDGLLVDPGDRLGLEVALSRLLQNPGLRKRLGDAAASTARDRYTIQSVVAAIESSYLEITGSGVAAM